MELADPHRSYAVLVGSAAYTAPTLEDLPAVANNLSGLRDLLQDPAVWGLPADHCTLVPEPGSPAEVLDAVHTAAERAGDALLVYYAGHGLAHPDVNGLLLSLPDTDPQRPYTALDFDAVRREVLGTGRGVNRIVILDCCYGGRAFEGGMSGATGAVQVAEQTRIAGSYLLTASAATRQAQAPPGEKYTAFTGELIQLLDAGLPGGDSVIEVSRIYEHLHAELSAKGRPLPQQRLSNTGRTLAFARNRYGGRDARPAPVAPASAPVPERLRETLRGKPRDIVAAATALRAAEPGESTEVLAHAGLLRPVQEVATMVWLLAGEEHRAERDIVHRAVADREPQEIVAYLEGLHALDGVEGAEQRLLEEVARRPVQTVAAVVRELTAGGYEAQRLQLLAVVRSSLRTTEHILDLLGALWSAGLDEDADDLLRTATMGSAEEAVVLADALVTIGRPDKAFELYLAHARVVVGRSVATTSRMLQAMAEAHPDTARQLLEVAVTTNPPGRVAELCESLSSVGLDPLVLEAARTAARADTRTVLDLADELRDRGRDTAVFHLLRAATALCPLPDVPLLIDALREMGRPVDANLLISEAADRAADDTVELWRRFTAQNRTRDAERLLAALVHRPARHRLAMLSLLCAARLERSRASGPQDPPQASIDKDPLFMSLLEGLATASDEDLLATLKLLRETDQPIALHALLSALVRQDPEMAVQDLDRLQQLRHPAEAAVLRALLADAGRGAVRDLSPGEIRTALGRVSTRADECVYAMAALCATGREPVVISTLLGITHAARARVTGQLLLLMRRHELDGCARALIREQSDYFGTQYPGGWGLLVQQLADDGLHDYVAFATSLSPQPASSPPPAQAEPAESRRGWFRGRNAER